MQYKNDMISGVIKILRKEMKIILIITMITVMIFVIGTKILIIPKYEASSKVFIGKENNYMENESKEEIDMYCELMETYSETIKTKDLIKESIRYANLNMKSEDILDNLTVQILSESRILRILVRHEDPKIARKIVEAISYEFINESKKLVINEDTKIIESVQVTSRPINPNLQKNILISIMMGLFMGTIIVFLLESKKITYNDIKYLEKKLELPVMGVIWNSDSQIQYYKSDISENYRILGVNLRYKFFDYINKVMVVTSSESKDGKSMIASNLGLTLCESGKKVIVIDCDFRKASLHEKFNISNDFGLSDILTEKKQFKEVINKYNDNLIILSTGKSILDPYEMFCSSSMECLLQYLRTCFDYIIIDAPTVHEDMIDVKILAEKADGILLVAKEGKSKKKSIIQSINILKKSNFNITGIVLNMVEAKKVNKYSS